MRLDSIKMAGINFVFFLAAAITASAQTFPVAGDSATKSLAGKSSEGRSQTGLASLPRDAQGPVAAALGKDDSRYWLPPSLDGFRGENPGQGLVVEFTKDGGEVRSHNLRWGLETRAYGYGNRLHRVKMVAPQSSANRVEYRRDGVTEWYLNGPLGLEQGFTLLDRPGKPNGQALTLELGLRGDLVAALEPGGKSLELRAKDGKRALRYTGLSVRDASGRELPSWLELRGERLLVRVEDEGARYPVVVDPWVQQAELTASDGAAGEFFGDSVAVSGGTIVVGARNGAAYVFTESGGTWSQQAELTASDGTALGASVAISGTTIVVGAPGSNSNQGAVYVFVESGGMWTEQAELTSSDGAAGDQLGGHVAINGTTIVADGGGAIYVFAQNGTTWSQQAELTASDGAAGDQFGLSLAVSGTTIVVGAPMHTVTNDLNNRLQGAAYVFTESGGTWSQQAELSASDGETFDDFGSSVAVDGTTIVVGALGRAFSQGAAYVFVESGGTWSQQAELTASDGVFNDEFGSSLAISGSTIMIGSPQHMVGSNEGQGAVYVFVESAGTWTQQPELTASDGGIDHLFGNSIAVSSGTMVVGDSFGGANSTQGTAYVFASLGPDQPAVKVTPPSIDFSFVPVNSSSSAIPVTLTNTGTGTLDITSITINGDFAISANTCGTTLDAGANCSLDVIFTPTRLGTQTGTLSFADNDKTFNPSPQTVALSGTGSAQVTLSPEIAAYGQQEVGTTSPPKTFFLFNEVALTDIAISVTGDFRVSGTTCGTSLPARHSCDISVTFTPTASGMRTGTLSVSDSANNSPQTSTLKGTGVVEAALTPTSAGFGSQALGTTSALKTFTLTNHQTVVLTSIVISTNGDFAVPATTCGTSLAAKSSCTISVTFTPTASGTRTGTLSVSDSSNNSPQTSSLTGTGAVQATPTLAPASATFGSLAVGTTSPLRTFTLTNRQTIELTGIAISTTGDFAVSETTCGTSLAAKSSCTMSVTFTPTASGTRTGTLSVSDSATNSPQTSSLKGAGFVPATLAPARGAYPKQAVGKTSAAQTFTLTNHQSVDLTSIVISITGDFAVSGTTCGTSLAASSSCTISVTFTPTATGTRTGTLSLSDSATNSPQTSHLTGSGQ